MEPTGSRRLEDDCVSLSTDEASDDEESVESDHGVICDVGVHSRRLVHTDR